VRTSCDPRKETPETQGDENPDFRIEEEFDEVIEALH
jgi:hypothetical protein